MISAHNITTIQHTITQNAIKSFDLQNNKIKRIPLHCGILFIYGLILYAEIDAIIMQIISFGRNGRNTV
jgi:hypothetical protein